MPVVSVARHPLRSVVGVSMLGYFNGVLSGRSAEALVFFGNSSFRLVNDSAVIPYVCAFVLDYFVTASCLMPVRIVVVTPFRAKFVAGSGDNFFLLG